MERRQWERKLHKNSINFRNREEIGGRKYCQNQLLNRRRTIVEQRNGNSEWDLFSWSGIGISSAERTRVILLKFRRWSSQTQNRVQSRGERLIRVITQSSCVDMIQKKKKEKKGKDIIHSIFVKFLLFPRTDSVWRRNVSFTLSKNRSNAASFFNVQSGTNE